MEKYDPGIGSLASPLVNTKGQRLLISKAIGVLQARAWFIDASLAEDGGMIIADAFARYGTVPKEYPFAWNEKLFALTDVLRLGETMRGATSSRFPTTTDLRSLGILRRNERGDDLYCFQRHVLNTEGMRSGYLEIIAAQGASFLTRTTKNYTTLLQTDECPNTSWQFAVHVIGAYSYSNPGWQDFASDLIRIAHEVGNEEAQTTLCKFQQQINEYLQRRPKEHIKSSYY